MKTTIEIADSLFREAKQLATREGTTLRALVEASLRQHLGREQSTRTKFRLKDRSFRGRGLQRGIQEGDWRAIRSLVYEGRGA